MKKIIKSQIDKIFIIILISLDQIIKIIVKGYYGIKSPIIKNILYFKPTLNEDYSWFNSMFNLQWTRFFHIVICFLGLLLSYDIFKYIYNKNGENISIRLLKIFLMSGILCSLIDKIFWNGSLDYILLRSFFVFDLKDCYITVFEIVAVILIIKDWASISKISSKELIEDYIKFTEKLHNIKRRKGSDNSVK